MTSRRILSAIESQIAKGEEAIAASEQAVAELSEQLVHLRKSVADAKELAGRIRTVESELVEYGANDGLDDLPSANDREDIVH